jgi:hypothetical protein
MIIPSPAIELKIAIQSQNVRRIQFGREVNQRRICQINSTIAVLQYDPGNLLRRLRQCDRNPKVPLRHIPQNRFRRPRNISQQIAALHNYRFGCNQGWARADDALRANSMKPLTAVERSHDYSCVQENRLHFPKPFMCSLLDARSGIPEANFPRPIILRGPLPG